MNEWQKAKIIKVEQVSSDMKSLIIEPERFSQYRAGQHYELRISEGGVSRKYSIVSSPYVEKYLEFGIQLLPNGALSPKLWDLKIGDTVEIRGPFGESFVWSEKVSGPLVLIGAGSGITPLLSIYDSYKHAHPESTCVFIMSAKDSSRIMKYDALKNILITRFTSTEGRIDAEFLKTHIEVLAKNPNTTCCVCGPENFIDDIVDMVSEIGISDGSIKSERFI